MVVTSEIKNLESPALEIKGLRKGFKDFTLKDINLRLNQGYVMGIIGPNGSGKTTTIKLIMNLLRKDKGSINILGLDHIEHEKEAKNRIGFVYDENHYYGMLTISEMKSLISPLYKRWDETLFQRYLKEFNLNPRQKIDNLSKGMKTKFSLAVALSHGAELIIMDEPTAGLDPVFRSELLDILYALMQDEGKSILFSTHITSDLERIADYITLMNNGEILLSAEKDTLLEEFVLIKGSTEVLESGFKNDLIGYRRNANGFEGLAKKSSIVRLGERKAVIERPSLDDIMIYHVKAR